MGIVVLLYFPTNKKTDHQNQKKTILVSWPLLVWDYITQSGSASSRNL